MVSHDGDGIIKPNDLTHALHGLGRPQRQMLPDMASSISASVGCGLPAMSAAADMIWPDWQ
jgi:hypothetical protein